MATIVQAPFWVPTPPDDAPRQLVPTGSALLARLLTAAGQPPTKQWRWDYDEASVWTGKPTPSALLAQLLTAGGQPPTKAWRWDYEDSGLWIGRPTQSAVLVPLIGQPTANARTFYHDDSSTWQWTYPLNRSLLQSIVPVKPFVPSLWIFPQDDPPVWQSEAGPSELIIPILTAGGKPPVNARTFYYDDSSSWQSTAGPSALLNPLLTAGGKPPANARTFNYDDSSSWQWQYYLNPDLLKPPGTPFTAFWQSYYQDDPPTWQSTAGKSSLLSLILTVGGQPPVNARTFNYDDSSDWRWLYWRNPNLLQPAGKPFSPFWQSYYTYDEPNWQSKAGPSALLAQLLTAAGQPFVNARTFNYDDSSSWHWQWLYSRNFPIVTPSQAPFKAFWQSYYTDEPPSWQSLAGPSTLLSVILTVGGKPPANSRGPLYNYDVAEPIWIHGLPAGFNVNVPKPPVAVVPEITGGDGPPWHLTPDECKRIKKYYENLHELHEEYAKEHRENVRELLGDVRRAAGLEIEEQTGPVGALDLRKEELEIRDIVKCVPHEHSLFKIPALYELRKRIISDEIEEDDEDIFMLLL
jgi:hypothetical protein